MVSAKTPKKPCSVTLLFWVGSLFVFASGCATVSRTGKDTTNEPQSVAQVINKDTTRNSSVSRVSDGEMIVQGIKLENTKFDYPVTINSRVEYWVDYFTGRGRKFFEKYLERSELFLPYIVPLLRQNNMPEDLVYLAMIESGFNNHARSSARAVGPWQFISATGKRYGLMVNWWVDERRDTYKSTLAAIQYLKELNEMFQSWELAAAAYNAGEAKIARAIRRYGAKDFWAITRHRFLRPETRDYVPKIIAAAIVSKNRTQFGFPASSVKTGQDEVIAGDGEVVKLEKVSENATNTQPTPLAQDAIAKILGEVSKDADEDEDEADGPEIVPASSGANLAVASEIAPLAKPIPTPHVSKNGQVGGEELAQFELRSPADLLKIARAAGLSYHTIKSLNPELLRWCTPPNVGTYRIKLPVSVKEKFLLTYNHESFPKKVQFLGYRVKGGETLSQIARRFGIKVDPMADLNGISSKIHLRKGTKIFLPMPEDRSRSLASLEIRDPPEKRRYRRKGRGGYRKISMKRRSSARSASISPLSLVQTSTEKTF